MFRLSRDLVFPAPRLARDDGLLAVGGDLSPERLMLAYANGIFPWFSEGDPILWWSPPVRPVLDPAEVHVGRSLAKTLRKKPYEIRLDTAFEDVIAACSEVERPDQAGTWITRDIQRAYTRLHRRGLAHSAEAWLDGELVGGLYGVCMGGVFFGESMFARAPDASKVAFVVLCRQLVAWNIRLIDSQVTNEHTARFGMVEIPRAEFLARVKTALDQPTRPGPWTLEVEI